MYSAIWLPRRYMITWLNVWRGDLLLRLPLHNPQGNWSTLCRMHGCMAAWQHAFHSTFNMIEKRVMTRKALNIEYITYTQHCFTYLVITKSAQNEFHFLNPKQFTCLVWMVIFLHYSCMCIGQAVLLLWEGKHATSLFNPHPSM